MDDLLMQSPRGKQRPTGVANILSVPICHNLRPGSVYRPKKKPTTLNVTSKNNNDYFKCRAKGAEARPL